MKSIKLLGGKVSDDWKSFTYSSSSLGPIGAVISGDLIKLHFSIGTVDYDKNGIPFRNDVAPYISESRTLVPIRAIAEALGATVSWVDSTKTVYMTKDGKTIHLSVGEELPNGLGGAVINSKRTFVPLRYVAEQLGANVVWNSENYTVDIYQ
ncbi:MAG: copper amine oxidase N-terminal domain-containing protein [Clostridiales bacterium]|nr:copper amine oxidase N-terminal domain-containing protein [Clostridiales bacterium]